MPHWQAICDQDSKMKLGPFTGAVAVTLKVFGNLKVFALLMAMVILRYRYGVSVAP